MGSLLGEDAVAHNPRDIVNTALKVEGPVNFKVIYIENDVAVVGCYPFAPNGLPA